MYFKKRTCSLCLLRDYCAFTKFFSLSLSYAFIPKTLAFSNVLLISWILMFVISKYASSSIALRPRCYLWTFSLLSDISDIHCLVELIEKSSSSGKGSNLIVSALMGCSSYQFPGVFSILNMFFTFNSGSFS